MWDTRSTIRNKVLKYDIIPEHTRNNIIVRGAKQLPEQQYMNLILKGFEHLPEHQQSKIIEKGVEQFCK